MKKKLLAVDGNSILNRAFYGVRPLSTKDGFPTNALYGTVNMITKQIEALCPDYRVVAFDLKAPTFRHKMYDAYKAGRRPMPEELALQLPVAKELLTALGFTVLELEGYEADDILGTLARVCEENGCDAYLMTGDKDSFQLISPDVHVLYAGNHDTIDMDEAAFFAKYGVASSQFVDVKALMGDSSDNIPGVAGIGEKGALKLISEYGNLEGIYEALPNAKHPPSLRAKLENGRESAFFSRELATICREVPLPITLDTLECSGIREDEARKLFLRLEFSAFIKRFGLDALSGEPKKENSKTLAVTEADLGAALSWIGKNDPIALEPCDAALRLSNGEEILLTSATPSELHSALQGKTLIVYDSKALYKSVQGAALRGLKLFDLMLAAYLCNSSKSNYELSGLVADYLEEVCNSEQPTVSYFLPLYRALCAALEETQQTDLLWNMEMPLALVLADMESVGFYVDREGIAAYGEQLGSVARALEAQIYFHAGKEFNINSPKQLGEILFDTLGLPHAKKTKTGYSTNAEILEKLRPAHPIIDDILDYRQVTKLKSTYTDGLLKVADENGRVHTTFKQTGTATGRLSSTEPNLQNIPVRTELGRELRRFFLPESPDYVIIDADYSQIELRLLAEVSQDANMIEAFRSGKDIHTSTAATVFGISPNEVTPEMRKKAKAVNFGILYGIGAFSLADDLHVSRAEAQEFIDRYLQTYPGIDAYLKETIRQAYESRSVRTLFGRLRHIPELADKNKMRQKFGERVAMNSPIQGTAADVIKLAMIRAHRMLREEKLDARLILQVHDELLIEAHKDSAERAKQILRQAMEGVADYAVPLTVEIQIGKTWFDAK